MVYFKILRLKLLFFISFTSITVLNHAETANYNTQWLKNYNSNIYNECKNNYEHPSIKNLVITKKNICDTFNKNMLLLRDIQKKYHKDGYFFHALIDKDISYQEVVSFLALLNVSYGEVFPINDIVNSIRWSFNNLRQTSGGFQQKGIVNGSVRTSLYIFSIVNACLIDARIMPICEEFSDDILKSAKWVSDFQTPWAGNHDLAALLMFYQLFELTKNIEILKMFKLKRKKIFDGFINIDDKYGYWPEAPKNWKNRMLTGYLQIQLIFGGHYLVLNPTDVEFKNLYIKQLKLFTKYADMSKLKLNVEDSYNYKENESNKWIALVTPALIYYTCLHTSIYCDYKDNIKHRNFYFENMRSNFKYDDDVTLFSDSYLRFGVIVQLENLTIARSNNNN